MYTAGHRALQAQALGVQRVEWLGRLPDSKEDVHSLSPTPPDDQQTSWFEIKSSCGFLPTSVVLLEKIIRKDDLDLRNEQTHFRTTNKKKSKFGRKAQGEKSAATTGPDLQQENRTNDASAVGAGQKRRRGKLTRAKTERGGEAEWRHGDAVRYGTGARTIDQGLRKDGLGPVPGQAATSLEVIRRMELSTEGFFEFLFSDRWSEGCLLRVLRGKLLDTLLYVLNQMQKDHNAVCYSTMAFLYENKPLVPCSKTATINNATGLTDKRILVQLDCFVPQTPPDPEVVLDGKQPSTQEVSDLCHLQSHSTSDDSGTLDTRGYRCNIRGQEKPFPQGHCFRPYHIQREPLLLRRHREQSCFVHPPLPWPQQGRCLSIDQRQSSTSGRFFSVQSLQSAAPSALFSSRSRDESCKREKKAPSDESFNGPHLKDGSETVASDPYLTPIAELISEGDNLPKKPSYAIEKIPVEESKSLTKDAKKKKKKTKARQGESSDDEEESDPEKVKLNIDPYREAMLRKDLEDMSSDIIAKKPISRSQREGRRARLEKKSKSKHRATEHEQGQKLDNINVTMKKPATEESDTKQKAAEEPAKSLLKKERPVGFPSIKQWPNRPTFTQFSHYLQQQDAEVKSAQLAKANAAKKQQAQEAKAKRQSTIKKKLEKLGASMRSDSIRSEKSVKQCDSNKSVTQSREKTTAGERKKNAGKPQKKDKKSRGKKENRKAARNQQRESADADKRKMTLIDIDEDAPYVYISDSEIPNDISAKTLFTLMQVDRNFKPEKLKSSYSFEKLYAHRAEEIPNYAKMLNKFSKPFKKKKPKVVPAYKKGVKKKGHGKPQSPTSPRPKTAPTAPSPPPPPEEPTSPPMVIGTLKDFKFLQYKNFIPNPRHSFGVPRGEMTPTDIVQLLSVAMQAFVVRRERATTFGWSQCDSKVSVTFSRPGPDDALLGVPPLKAPACIDGKSSGDPATAERLHT